ncbi:MAG: AbrB/MazE/SpoVT family DNA-binding domain-containing protein [Candidatus Dormibacteraeota bacterium]|uniref:AbrB/MazE/SpoVT family DNA-binding domain-containing protein n=1 Tax=Candidatus Amunia macphersoniae TaxID=3127014 RepID=A0A934KLR8_9BACT|nr:AbrB/MazE/SpoVT family DNA-binding domain-containing protein [Candidatus Dormibacteraeota bacterium]
MEVKKRRPRGRTRMSAKRQVTIPVAAALAAGLSIGEQLEIRVEGPGRLTIRRVGDPVDDVAGLLDGCYAPGYLEQLRREWR